MPVVPSGGTSISANDSQPAGARAQELGLVVALGEVRRDGQPELGARPVEVDRARVRGVRRDAESNVV